MTKKDKNTQPEFCQEVKEIKFITNHLEGVTRQFAEDVDKAITHFYQHYRQNNEHQQHLSRIVDKLESTIQAHNITLAVLVAMLGLAWFFK